MFTAVGSPGDGITSHNGDNLTLVHDTGCQVIGPGLDMITSTAHISTGIPTIAITTTNTVDIITTIKIIIIIIIIITIIIIATIRIAIITTSNAIVMISTSAMIVMTIANVKMIESSTGNNMNKTRMRATENETVRVM
jgi:hypothetical protein